MAEDTPKSTENHRLPDEVQAGEPEVDGQGQELTERDKKLLDFLAKMAVTRWMQEHPRQDE